MRGVSARDEVGRDRAGRGGFEVADGDAAAAEFEPGIDVRGIVAVVAHDFVAGLPVEAVGKEREAERGRAEQGDFVGVRAEELRAGLARALYVAEDVAEFLMILRGLARVVAHGIGHAAREGGDGGVREEDFVPADGEEIAADGFVWEKIHGYS